MTVPLSNEESQSSSMLHMPIYRRSILQTFTFIYKIESYLTLLLPFLKCACTLQKTINCDGEVETNEYLSGGAIESNKKGVVIFYITISL